MVYLLCEKDSQNCNNQMLLKVGFYKCAYGSWHQAEMGRVPKSYSSSFPCLQTKSSFPLHSPSLVLWEFWGYERHHPPLPSPILAWSFSYVFSYILHWAEKHWGTRHNLSPNGTLSHTYWVIAQRSKGRCFITLMKLKFQWPLICTAPSKEFAF